MFASTGVPVHRSSRKPRFFQHEFVQPALWRHLPQPLACAFSNFKGTPCDTRNASSSFELGAAEDAALCPADWALPAIFFTSCLSPAVGVFFFPGGRDSALCFPRSRFFADFWSKSSAKACAAIKVEGCFGASFSVKAGTCRAGSSSTRRPGAGKAGGISGAGRACRLAGAGRACTLPGTGGLATEETICSSAPGRCRQRQGRESCRDLARELRTGSGLDCRGRLPHDAQLRLQSALPGWLLRCRPTKPCALIKQKRILESQTRCVSHGDLGREMRHHC